MPTVVIEDSLIARLTSEAAATGQVTLANHAGKVLGIFVPNRESSDSTYPGFTLTPEEIERRRNEKGRFSMEEIRREFEAGRSPTA